jgi:hypothetical protein
MRKERLSDDPKDVVLNHQQHRDYPKPPPHDIHKIHFYSLPSRTGFAHRIPR